MDCSGDSLIKGRKKQKSYDTACGLGAIQIHGSRSTYEGCIHLQLELNAVEHKATSCTVNTKAAENLESMYCERSVLYIMQIEVVGMTRGNG